MRIVYTDPEYAEIRENLHQQLEDLRAHYNDSDELTPQFLERDLAEE